MWCCLLRVCWRLVCCWCLLVYSVRVCLILCRVLSIVLLKCVRVVLCFVVVLFRWFCVFFWLGKC